MRAQSVTLTDNGTTVTLANGLVTAIINKGDGKISSFKVGSSPNLLDSDGAYYTTHTVSNGTDYWVGIGTGGATYSVTTNTSSLVDISIRNTKLGYNATLFPNGMFDVDMHFVMRSGVAGIYRYFVWRHNAGHPSAGLYQQRTTVAGTSLNSIGTPVYSYAGTDSVWNYAPGAALASGSTIYDSTIELPVTTSYTYPTGTNYQTNWPKYYSPNSAAMIGLNYNLNPVWTKYDWSVYSGPETSSINTFGVANSSYGVWILNPSQEWLNGGPTKLRGTVQDVALGINTNEGHGLGAGPDQSLAAGQVWSKIYGPYLIYANAGTSNTALWADAKAKGAAEVAAWPYSWLTAPGSTLYPTNRGTITGQLTIPGANTANAQIILCDRSDIDWTWQGAMNYLFSTRADSSGNFTLPKVRPGTYSLFAYVPGTVGQYQLNSVVVTGGATTALGTLTWNPPIQQQRIFRIGTPDRSTEEFRFGNMPKQFGLWWRWLDEVGVSGSVNYTVGTSDPATNWYYAQSVVSTSTGGYTAPSSFINFTLSTLPPSPCTFTLALAGASGSGAVMVQVNGTDIAGSTGTFTEDDSALDRDAVVRGQYRLLQFSFSPSLLMIGSNQIKIKVRSSGSQTWTGTRPPTPTYGIMFDCVQLEAGASATNTLLSQSKAATASSAGTSNTIAKGNNGSNADRWEASSTTLPQWWRVDLGSARTVRAIKTKWYSTIGYKYRIQGSNDDANWTTLVTERANTVTGTTYDTLPSTTPYRYIRIYVTASTGGAASFYETQVYGD